MPPSLPSSRPGYTNGIHHDPSSKQPVQSTPGPANKGPGFLAPFLGAFAAVIALAVIGLGIYFGIGLIHSSSGDSAKNPLLNVASWQLGREASKPLDASAQPDIGWWNKTFNLPKPDAVTGYLKGEGIDVSNIEPVHYEETKDGTTLTYEVHAQVPQQLLRLQAIPWRPTNPDLARYSQFVVLNHGQPAGMEWDTQNVMIAAEAGSKLDFAWKVHYDKNANTVTTDRLPFSDNVFTRQQVDQYQTESAHTVADLQAQIDQINAQVQGDMQAHLSQIPPNPPKPQLLSSQWGGDGSGEPTKSAERIGGGAAAGAAGGAAFGAMAGNAGMGAGVGAGVGLLGGVIYDAVSKSNDRKRHEAEVEDENDERMDNWHQQIKSLNAQRAQAKKDAAAEREKYLEDLGNRIATANGHLENIGAANSAPQPGANQPSGPIQ